MRYSFLLFTLLTSVFSCQKNSNYALSAEQKEALHITLKEFNTAFKDGDLEILDELVSDTYRHTNSNAKAISKEAWLNYLHKRKKDLDEGRLKVLSYEMDEKDIQFYGTTAIITARIKVTSQNLGEEQHNAYRVTNIWVYDANQWKRAGFHDGKIE